jgi:hypothetical protein
METGRRDFLTTLTLGTLGVSGFGIADLTASPVPAQAGRWNLDWVRRLRGRYRAVFDVPVIEDGYGVWRAIIWRKQYAQVFGVPEASLSTVVILRHDAIALTLNQEFWSRYEIGKQWGVLDPATRAPTTRNPIIDRTGPHALPAQFTDFTLEALMEGGAVVLGCALALRDCATIVAQKEKIGMDEADRRVQGMIVPGVLMQPSGVFAAVLAQDNGCRYVRAS